MPSSNFLRKYADNLCVPFQNCSRNLLSFSKNNLISSIPYLSIVILSIPMRNAKPVYLSGSYPAYSNTRGLIMPAPSTSSQPLFLQTLHPVPLQIIHPISISALGSVKGKKLGRNLTGVLG